MFLFRKLSANAVSDGTPGLRTTISIPISISFGNSPITISALVSSPKRSLTASGSTFLFSSKRIGFAPTFSNSFVEPIPLIPHPTTSTFFLFKFMFSSFLSQITSFRYIAINATKQSNAVTIENTATTRVSDHPHSSK